MHRPTHPTASADDGAAPPPPPAVPRTKPPRHVATRRDAIGASAALLASCLATLSPPSTAGETGLPAPVGPVLLSLEGRVRHTNAPGRADFDDRMLADLPQHSFVTQTPWYRSPRQFGGPLLRDVLRRAGADGQRLLLVALNDYRVEMPAQDAERHDVIVARRLDGQPMAVRDKGPLFVVYPFDLDPELRSAAYYSRSAWQLRRIEVR